jgi:energy-coupling factor transporter ATP-binding protein EcfA2
MEGRSRSQPTAAHTIEPEGREAVSDHCSLSRLQSYTNHGDEKLDEVVVEVEDLTFTYSASEEKALKGITLDIRRGEYVAIVGANGAGKTTFCLHINGILPVVLGGRMGGRILVLGREPCEHRVYEIAQNVGMVLQDPEAQLFSADILSEVAFAAENRGIPRDEMRKLIEWALDVVRLKDYIGGFSAKLSGGQKQRLAIAANLVIRPEILVLDEPTSQLDPIGTSEVFATLRDLNKDVGMTIVVATHKCDEISNFADRIVVLEKGNLILEDTPRKVFWRVPRLREALVHVPEVAELDYQIRMWLSGGMGVSSALDEANVTLEQANRSITGYVEAGKLKPSGTFEVGLGRSVPEKAESGNADTILEIDDVSYRYSEGAPLALSDVSIRVKRGEVVGIIGQNGAGKTTLMKCATGLLRPTSGTIRIDGQDVTGLDALEIAKLAGLILQNPDNQLFQMSSEEEIAFGLKNLGLDDEEIARRIDEVLDLTGMEAYRDIYPFKLSLGDRRKLAVASIFAMHPSILIFDEPTTGQDFAGRYQLSDLAIRLNRLGATIIMISHDMSLIARYTQRTLVMGKSKVLLDAPTREVFSHTDILDSTFLEPPPAIQLAQELQRFGVPTSILTVEELFNALTGEQIESTIVLPHLSADRG